jgi:hypothetical protein
MNRDFNMDKKKIKPKKKMPEIQDKQLVTNNSKSIRDKKGRFVKGVSGNAAGRPKKENSIADILRDIGDETIIIKDGVEMTKKEALLRHIYSLAFEGEAWAANFIADRTDGRPAQSLVVKKTDEIVIVVEMPN